MIPLRLKAKFQDTGEPFVVRLRMRADGPDLPFSELGFDAPCIGRDDDHSSFSTVRGTVALADLDLQTCDGDVVLLVPQQGMAHRLIRANSEHNTFLVTERCDQLCVMCSQPPKDQHLDLFKQFETAALLAPRNAVLGVSGGEPTLFKQDLFKLLSKVTEARPDLTFHVLTNGQHFEPGDEGELRTYGQRVLWGIPLYSSLSWQHDELVGKKGAFESLMKSLIILGRAGSSIELRTVVMTANEPALPLLALYVTRHLPFVAVWALMQLERIGYGRKNWDALFFDNSKSFDMIGRALDIARARGVDANLYNFPLCTVPPLYRAYAQPTISDWKRKYLSVCGDCSERGRCGGFFEWYADDKGFERVGP